MQIVHLEIVGQTALEPVGKIFLGSVAYSKNIYAQSSERVNVSPSVLGIIRRYKNNIHKSKTSGIENLYWVVSLSYIIIAHCFHHFNII